MRVLKGLIGITSTKILLILLLLIFGCKRESNGISGKWVNVNFDLSNYLIYDFHGNNIYLTSQDGIVKKKWEIYEDNLQMIDMNGRIERYEILVNSADSLILKSESEVFTLLPKDNFNLFICNDFEKRLTESYWKYSLNGKNQFLEFLNNGKYLVSVDDSSIAIGTGNWNIINKDSICVLFLKDIVESTSFVEVFTSDKIKVSLWNDNHRINLTLTEEEVENHILEEVRNMVDGRWEITEAPTDPNVPDIIEFINEEGYREYFFRFQDLSPKFGSWDLSRNKKTIILDNLDNGHRSYMKIMSLDSQRIKLNYLGSDYNYLKTPKKVLQ